MKKILGALQDLPANQHSQFSHNLLSAWLCIINGMSKMASLMRPNFSYLFLTVQVVTHHQLTYRSFQNISAKVKYQKLKSHSCCRTAVLPYIQSCSPLQSSSCKMPSILIVFTCFLQGRRNLWVNEQIVSPKFCLIRNKEQRHIKRSSFITGPPKVKYMPTSL